MTDESKSSYKPYYPQSKNDLKLIIKLLELALELMKKQNFPFIQPTTTRPYETAPVDPPPKKK